MHLAVQLPAVGAGSSGLLGPPPDFDAYVRLARAAERGLFDFVLLARDPRPGGGGPEPVTVLNALAAVTDHIGLAVAATADATTAGREPYDFARRIAALDRLSAGRAAGPALAVRELTGPRGPQGRPVVIGEGDDGAAEVVVTDMWARPGTGARLLRRIAFALDGPEFDGPEPDGLEAAAVEAAAETPGPPLDNRFGGSARALAARLDASVQSGAVDGYVLLPEPAPGGRGLDAFVDRVVPLLQERGSLRTAYRGTTLRAHLGLPEPVWKA